MRVFVARLADMCAWQTPYPYPDAALCVILSLQKTRVARSWRHIWLPLLYERHTWMPSLVAEIIA